LFAACAAPPIGPGPNTPPVTRTDVAIELASVTLADDCPDPEIPQPETEPPFDNGGFAKPPADESRSEIQGDVPAGRWATPGYAPRMRMCEQTSMQLSLRGTGNGEPTSVRVKRVELLDEDNKMIGELLARNAMRWSDDGTSYLPWDQSIAAGQLMSASYSLSAPDWSVLDGGRWAAHARQFKLRVTFTVGDKDRTVEKQATVAAMIEPHVVT
jgi:hypothetical protein